MYVIQSTHPASNQTLTAFGSLYDVIQRLPNMPITAAGSELEVVINVTSQMIKFLTNGILSFEKLYDIINMADFLMRKEFLTNMKGYSASVSRLLKS